MALDDEQLAPALERQSHSILGKFTIAPGRHVFPLAIETPEHLAAKRIALVGEAAHVMPPIGAQASTWDCATPPISRTSFAMRCRRATIPDRIRCCKRYARTRRADVFSRIFAVDMANRTLLSDFLPAQALRAAGMQVLNSVGPIRRFAMREGLSPSWRR